MQGVLAKQAAQVSGAGGDPAAAASAAKCAGTAQNFIMPLQKATLGLVMRAQGVSRVLAIILLLFIVHQVTRTPISHQLSPALTNRAPRVL